MSDRRRLVTNFSALFSVKVAQYLLPLVTVPYLVRVLGPEKFGLVAFAQAFVWYFILITNYGFDFSTTREISMSRDDNDACSEIFSAVMSLKLLLLLTSFAILCFVVFLFPQFAREKEVYFYTFGMVIGFCLFPLWAFQGLERMKHVASINLVSRALYTVCIFTMIRSSGDYIYVPLFNSLSMILSGLVGLWFVRFRFGIKYQTPSMARMKYEMKQGGYIFISSAATSLYTISSTFILGLMTNNTLVGFYSAADKIIKAAIGLIEPFSQAVYPHVSLLAKRSRISAANFVHKMVGLVFIPGLVLSAGICIFAPVISHVVLGPEFQKSVVVIRVLAFLPLIIALSNVFGTQGLTAFGYYSVVTKIIGICAVIHVGMLVLMTRWFSYVGTAVSLVITEMAILVIAALYYRKHCLRSEDVSEMTPTAQEFA